MLHVLQLFINYIRHKLQINDDNINVFFLFFNAVAERENFKDIRTRKEKPDTFSNRA